MVTCAAHGCTNRSGKSAVTFHRFPKDNARRDLWIKALQRKDWEPTEYSKVCSEHFRETDIDRTSLSVVRIRDGGVPCIFSSFPSYELNVPKQRRISQKRSREIISAKREEERNEQSSSSQMLLPKDITLHPGTPHDNSVVHIERTLGIVCAVNKKTQKKIYCSNEDGKYVFPQKSVDIMKEEPLPPENDDCDYRSEMDSQRCKSYGTKMADMEMDPLVNIKQETDPLPTEEQTDTRMLKTHHVWLQDVKLESVKIEPESDPEDCETNYCISENPLEFPVKDENQVNDCDSICSSPQQRDITDEDFPPGYMSLYDKVKVEITEGHISPTIEQNSDHTGCVSADRININSVDLADVEQTDLQQWESGVRQTDTFSCRDCGDNFTKFEDLSNHRRKRDEPVTCELCDKNFKSECVLATHIRIHTGERPFQCKICGKTFLRICYLLKHRRKRHGCTQPGIPCQICGKVFSNFGLLSAHTRAHYNAPKVLSCEQCGKHFRRTKYLNRHKRCTHSVDKLRCELCGEVQETRTALISHVVKHTGALPFNCAECDQEFSSTLQLARHSRIHKGELPFACNDCELSFMTGEQLRSHKRYHTGERPFCCVFCGRSFRNEPDLIVHVYSHTDP